jgi:hypothetical protein
MSLSRAAVSVIEGLESRTLFSTIQVTNGMDEDGSGNPVAGSLRAAIVAADAAPGSTISFSTLPAGTTITLNADLTSNPISAQTTIDGTTAPGGRVTIDGAGFNGLDVTATGTQAVNVEIKGLWLQNMGAALTLDGTTDALITDNYIGDVTGSGTGKNVDGIVCTDGTNGDTIGGTTAADMNVISGNSNSAKTGIGIYLESTSAPTGNITIEGNYIGVTSSGSVAAPNDAGIELSDSLLNTISDNVISGNTTFGIQATDPSDTGYNYGNTITGNIIGMDSTAKSAVPNGQGIFFDGGDLSGDSVITSNTIEDNAGIGIEINEGSDDSSLGNVSGGDTIADNTIANNGGSGVVIDSAAENNTISENSIYLNGNSNVGGATARHLGIDLGNDGVTQNTATSGTTETGANGLTPFPVIGTIGTDPNDSTMLQIPISIQGNPSTSYTVEIFASTPADASSAGYGQGQTYVTNTTVTTDTSGAGSGSVDISNQTYAGYTISATATNASQFNATQNVDAGATSEFSADVVAPGTALPQLTITGASGSVGSTITFPVTLSSASTSQTTFTYTFTKGTAPLSDLNLTGTITQTGTFSLAAGTTKGSITVPVVADSTGGNETFTLTLSALSGNALFSNLQSTDAVTGTILASSTGTTASTTTLTASPTSAAAGASVTLTATVTGTGGTPGGTVTFYSGTTQVGTATLNAQGVATTTTTTLPVGTDSVTAVYGGSTKFSTSTSVAVTVTITGVTMKATTTTLAVNPTAGGVGTSVTFTATVTGIGTTTTPMGNVQFSDNGTIIGTTALNGSGKATFTTANLPVGTDGIIATYVGSTTFSTSTSSTVNVTITSIGTGTSSTTLTASPSSAGQGSSVTLTATVSPGSAGGATPTGSVSFIYNGSSLGSGTLNASGQASLTVTTLPIGSDSITATYSGDSTYGTSTSTATTVTITSPLTNTTTTLSSSASTVAHGTAVTLTAGVHHTAGSATPTGSITFTENGITLGTVALNGSATATLTLSTLAPGTNAIIANYTGDTNYLYSSSPLVTVLVTSQATTSLAVSTNSVIVTGTTVALTATVTPVIAGGGTPSGDVTFYDNGSTVLGIVALQSDATATLTLPSLAVGSNTITAVYGGEAAYPSSTSPASTLTVLSAANVGATLTTNVTINTVAGNAVTVTSTVTPKTGSAIPTGTVTFYTNSVLLGTATVQSDGTAVLTTTSLLVGSNNITAIYSGNTVYTPSPAAESSAFVNTLGLVPAIISNTVPSGLVAGSITHGVVTVTLTNVTSALIREPQTTIHLYASMDGTIDANSVLLDQLITGVKLKAGKVQTVKLRVKQLPATMAGGTYTLMVRVSNPVGTFGYFFPGQTLSVIGAHINLSETLTPVNVPTGLVSGDDVGGAAQLVLTNGGNIASTGPITVELTASPTSGVLGTVIETVSVNTVIQPGASRTVQIPFGTLPTLAAGSYFIVAQVTDPLGVNTLVSSTVTVPVATTL